MATLLNYQTNKPEDVPDSSVQDLVASGSHALPNGPVHTISPEGKNVTIQSADAAKAFSSGYLFLSPGEVKEAAEEKKYGDRPIAAGAAGLARGASFGLSDMALTGSGLVNPQTLEGLRGHNEGVSTGSEIAGTLGSFLVPGLAEVGIGKGITSAAHLAEHGIASALGEGALAKITGKVGAGVLEGNAFGMLQKVDESVLGDTPLTAEKLLSDVGLDSLIGGGASLAGHFIGKGIKSGLEKLGSTDLKEVLRTKAAQQAVRSLGATGAETRKLGDRLAGVGKELVDSDLVGKSSSEIKAVQNQAGEKIGSVLKQVDESGNGKFNMQNVIDRVNTDVLAEARANPVLKKEVAKIEGYLDDFAESHKQGVSFEEANKMKSALQEKINYVTDPKTETRMMKRFGGIFGDEIKNQVEAIAPDLSAEFNQAHSSYGNLKEASKIATRAEGRGLGNRTISLTDYISGGALGGMGASMFGLPGVIGAGAGALINKAARSFGPEFISKGLSKLAESPFIDTLSKSFQQSVQSAAAQAPNAFGRYTGPLMHAAANGPGVLTALNIRLMESDPQYRQVMHNAGFAQETPEQTQNGLARLAQLQQIKNLVAQHDKPIDKGISRLVGPTSQASQNATSAVAPEPKSREARVSEFNKAAQSLNDLAQNPEKLANNVSSGMSELNTHAPNLALALNGTATQAVQFLAGKLPKNPNQNVLPGLNVPWEPSDAQLSKFNRYQQAVKKPKSVLSHMRKGTATPEEIEALKAVYPSLANEIKSKISEKLAGKSKAIPYEKRLMLSQLFGETADKSTSPAYVMHNQAAYHGAGQQPPPDKPVKTSQKGLSAVDVSNRFLTPQQASAGRR